MSDYIYKKQAVEALITSKMEKWIKGKNFEVDTDTPYDLKDWRNTPIKFMREVILDEKDVLGLKYDKIFRNRVRGTLKCLTRGFENTAYEKITGYKINVGSFKDINTLRDLPYFAQVTNIRTCIELEEPIEGRIKATVALRATLAWARPEWDRDDDK